MGVEPVNRNHGQDVYPPEQFYATVDLVAYLVDRYGIRPEWIVTHEQISTVGKTDPRGFDVAYLLDNVFSGGPGPDKEQLRHEAWRALAIPYSPGAAFGRYAREQPLGAPVTLEFSFTRDGVEYRAQGYAGGILCARVGDWDNMRATHVWLATSRRWKTTRRYSSPDSRL